MATTENEEAAIPEEPPSTESQYDLSFDKIASKLLKEGFLLTALELHAELTENGKEIPRLRDFFSNPGNFEKPFDESLNVDVNVPSMVTNEQFLPPLILPRTSSVTTFDSLDLTRYSDDGDKHDERIALLEFDLRKARETIKSLRASLTVSSGGSSVTNTHGHNMSASEFDTQTSHLTSEVPIKPHEKRAINFLINEYLLTHNHRLTAITFSDENEDQDFENWDDVGLNISKPPSLLQLYRHSWWNNYSDHHGQPNV